MLQFKSGQYLALACTLALAIIILSLWPGSDLPKINWFDFFAIDKIGHFAMYSCTAWSFSRYHLLKFNKSYKLQIGFCLFLLGFILEIIQGTGIIGRHFDLMDLISNIAGILTGLFIYDRYLFPLILINKSKVH